MLKLRSGKILQKPQQKEKSSRNHRNKDVQSFRSPRNKTTRSNNSPAEHYSPKTKAVMTKKQRKVSKLPTNQVYRRKNNGNLTTSDEKLLQSIFTKGQAAFGSVQHLQKSTNLQPRKVKQFLANKNAHKI